MISTAISPAIGGAMATATSRHNQKRQRVLNILNKAKALAAEKTQWEIGERVSITEGTLMGLPTAIHLEREGRHVAMFVTILGGNSPFSWKSAPFVLNRQGTESAYMLWRSAVIRQATGEARKRSEVQA